MLNVCIVADEAEPLASEAERRLRAEGHDFQRVDARRVSGLELATTIDRSQAVLVIRPREREAYLATGLALGRGRPLLLLDAGSDFAAGPGAERLSSLDDVVSALRPLAEASVFVHADQFRAQGACNEAVDWFSRCYPEGGNTRDWTREEQVNALRNGGAPWLLLARKRRLAHIWPMDGVDLRKADLRNADFRRLNFAGAWLEDADLRDADLLNTLLSGAHLARARLDGARLKDAELRDADLTGASLVGARLLQTRMARCRLVGANLREADLTHADLSDADLRGADLRGANLSGVRATGANFEGCDLSNAHLMRVSLRGARIKGARLTGSNLHHADLTGADQGELELTGAYLVNTTGVMGSRRE
ncbi:pentapeptide repeat-containing protein [Corallococcus exercitus]|uniref:pentapeptide repeat-containing protein n=1 Tax=Corallococcus exercitus TaxID=2316736 RepID=UPI000EA2F2E2|nr:pentapeptide repeat-containing protein [Corallococcus exercitus]RKG79679.1 pentapeptide repeat-containing protein [Corallococcus exercitus]